MLKNNFLKKYDKKTLPIEWYVYFHYIKKLILCKKKRRSEPEINSNTEIKNMDDMVFKMKYVLENVYDMKSLRDLNKNQVREKDIQEKLKLKIQKLVKSKNNAQNEIQTPI